MFGFEFADGSFIILGFALLYTLAVVHGLYSRRGSGISQRPYHHVYGGAPGAGRAGRLGGCPDRDPDRWSRGTR